MNRTIAIVLVTIFCLAVRLAPAHAEQQWLRCSLTLDIVRNSSGEETTKPLTGSVIFVIDDRNQTFYTYGEATHALTKLNANVQKHQVTFFDGPLSDTISRETGAFNVVESPFHEAHGSCVPIAPLAKDKPKF